MKWNELISWNFIKKIESLFNNSSYLELISLIWFLLAWNLPEIKFFWPVLARGTTSLARANPGRKNEACGPPGPKKNGSTQPYWPAFFGGPWPIFWYPALACKVENRQKSAKHRGPNWPATQLGGLWVGKTTWATKKLAQPSPTKF